MTKLKSLFNLDLIRSGNIDTRFIGEVTSLSIFEQNTKNFNVDGLFSTIIFGEVGSIDRNEKYGVIKLNVKILHPMVYKHFSSLRKLYMDMMYGKEYGRWDSKLKDFVPSNVNEGVTGYEAVVSKIKQIKFNDNDSVQRKFKIRLLDKYKFEELFIDSIIVVPAGLRDYTMDENGKPSEDEMNDYYRAIMSNAKVAASMRLKDTDVDISNPIRIRTQLAMDKLYHYIFTIISGKTGFSEGKWQKRGIAGGTANVITGTPPVRTKLQEPKAAGYNHTLIGLYQYIYAIKPIVKHRITTMYINRIFDPNSTKAKLVDKKSMTTKYLEVSNDTRDVWLSEDGLNKIMSKFSNEALRNDPILVEDNYLLLMHNTGKTLEIVYDTNDIDPKWNKKHLVPMTYGEFFYLAVVELVDKYPALLTRYPAAQHGNIYPTIPYLQTTMTAKRIIWIKRNQIDENGKVITEEIPLTNYIDKNSRWLNSLSPNASRLERTGGDFDGDKVNFTVVYDEDSVKELKDILKSKEMYISPTGELTFSTSTATIEYVMKSMTGGLNK